VIDHKLEFDQKVEKTLATKKICVNKHKKTMFKLPGMLGGDCQAPGACCIEQINV
jgi:hypothetical protein